MNQKMKRVYLWGFFFVCLFGGLWMTAGNTYASSYHQHLSRPDITDTSVPSDVQQPVVIRKTDPNGTQLQDAEISVVDSNGVVQKNIVTTYKATTLNMAEGTYFLHETDAPAGYQKAADVTFNVKVIPDSRNGETITMQRNITNYDAENKSRIQFSDGAWHDAENGILYQFNSVWADWFRNTQAADAYYSQETTAGTYLISYGTENKLKLLMDSPVYEGRDMAALQKELIYLINHGYNGTAFSGLSNATSYAATQLAIFQAINDRTFVSDEEIMDQWNNGDAKDYLEQYFFFRHLDEVESTLDMDAALTKSDELLTAAKQAAADENYDPVEYYMLYFYKANESNYENYGMFPDWISAAKVTSMEVIMVDEKEATETTETTEKETPKEEQETPKEEKETPKTEKKTVNAQTVQTNGVQTGSAVHTMMWTIAAISALGAAAAVRKEM
ncbi:prealbumin-like fold domain-containing protein [Catenisphaera adipataccumulans]|uniref:SpaA-like prealbumin fold domain-containing protein n=1 Tax=Catenisphaera adipataccumulans TaxID=700500 RepID=A0A7W8FVS8_9FIRM|nr:prealbumin-like fold domain-containing protein [Catenisphaera adipataccumulans]MBB5182531.1 hypothetical protein [Catenisphaera adipataccumulans]